MSMITNCHSEEAKRLKNPKSLRFFALKYRLELRMTVGDMRLFVNVIWIKKRSQSNPHGSDRPLIT